MVLKTRFAESIRKEVEEERVKPMLDQPRSRPNNNQTGEIRAEEC